MLKMLCLIFHETFLPINTELPLTVKITLDVNDYLLRYMTCKTCEILCMLDAAFGV